MANIAEATALNNVSIIQLSMVRMVFIFTRPFNKSGTLLVYKMMPNANVPVATALRIVINIQLSMSFKRSSRVLRYKELGGTVERSGPDVAVRPLKKGSFCFVA